VAAHPGNGNAAVSVSVALFASGSGSNVAALLDHRSTGAVRPRYRCLIGNNSQAAVMALARARGVPAYHVSRHTHPNRDAYLARLLEILALHDIELVVLAGYMKLLPAEIVRRWRGRILNIHPALLPRHGGSGMYGMAPHRSVLAAGEPETGVTVHQVDEQYDDGPIVLQRRVPVRPGDTAETLARRVLAAEHDTYWRAVEQVAASLAAGREHVVAGTPRTEAAR
jgi:formyltetrahydrofolate-dependent phosphoribosylglycinamide formyltransferase